MSICAYCSQEFSNDPFFCNEDACYMAVFCSEGCQEEHVIHCHEGGART